MGFEGGFIKRMRWSGELGRGEDPRWKAGRERVGLGKHLILWYRFKVFKISDVVKPIGTLGEREKEK
jgi:hypothetical protein